MGISTTSVHAGRISDPTTGSILPPIYQTATYVLEEVGKTRGFDYTRTSNPTRQALETCIAALDEGKFALAFASGMSAIDAVIRLLAVGDHIVSGDDVYGGTTRLFNRITSRSGISVSYVDTSNTQNVLDAIKPETKLIWVETPTNPLLKLSDLEKIAQIAKERNLILAVDSTFATPCLLKPLSLGADIVVHSTTKYLSGHNQLVGGVCVTNEESLAEGLKFIQGSVGAVPSPFDCWLTLLGIKTLSLRMERHCVSALEVANYLQAHPAVERVIYPGLESHPQHQLALRQQSGFGGMISFELRGGYEAGVQVMNNLQLISLAESLGAVETMITHPASMTHVCVPREERLARGLTDGLVRLSVGIEEVEDIIGDLEQALARISHQRTS